MGSFCRDPLIDVDLMWNTKNPNVTDCMRDTLLASLPLIVLLLTGFWRVAFSLIFPSPSSSNQCKLTKLFWARLSLIVVLLFNAGYNATVVATTAALQKGN